MTPTKPDVLIHTEASIEQVMAARGLKYERGSVPRWFLLLQLGVYLGASFACLTPYLAEQLDDDDQGDDELDNTPDNLTPIPSATPESGVTDKGVVAQIYMSPELDFSTAHFFNTDQQGNPTTLYGFIARNASELVVETDTDKVAVQWTGEDFSKTKEYEVTNTGYGAQETIGHTEMVDWLAGMEPSDVNADTVAELQRYLEDNTGYDVPVRMQTKYNLNSVTNQLVDMDLTIEFTLADGTVKTLTTKLEPLEKMDVFSDQQIASVDIPFGANGLNGDVIFELVPDTWTELEDGLFVSPEFVVEQEKIGENEGYSLSNDGMIIYEGDTIPGVQLTADGRYVVVVGDEMLVVDLESVHFGEDGEVSIDGFELNEEGEWVEVISEAMQAAEQHFADLGYPTDGVDFVEGEVTVTGRVDGVKVFEMNIKSGEFMFDQDYVIEQASQMKLDPSDLGPREDILKATGQYHIDAKFEDKDTEYLKDMRLLYKEKYKAEVADFDFNLAYPKSSVSYEMLDPEINAWGVVLELDYKDPETPRYFYYRDEVGEDYLVPLMPEK